MILNRELIAAAAAFPLALAATGCTKQPRETTAAEAEAAQAAQRGAPEMFEAVPADTPYLFASVDPWPEAIWTMYGEMLSSMEGALEGAEDAALGESTPPAERFLFALVQEIATGAGTEGLEALGFSTEPRTVFYGLGIVPVLRIELADPEALREGVARIEKRSDYELPVREIAGYDVWWFSEGGGGLAVTIVGEELVATFGAREAALSGALEVLFGERELGETLSESAVRELAEDEGLMGAGFGYVDLRRVTELLLGAGEGVGGELTVAMLGGAPDASKACADAAAASLAHAPRLSFGYTEISEERFAMEGTLELSAELAELTAQAQTGAPGVTGSFEEPPLFAMGSAIDLRAGKRVLERIASELQAVGDACAEPDVQRAAAELAATARGTIPPPFSSIRGGMLVVQNLDPAKMRGEGYAIAAIDHPAALLSLAKPFIPQLADLEIPSDGVFRPVPKSLTQMMPFDLGLTFAIGDSAVAVAAGDAGKSAAEAAMATEPDASPLFAMAYDYKTFFELMMQAMPSGGMSPDERAVQQTMAAMASYLGPMTTVVTPGERGLRFHAVMDVNSGAGE